MMNKKCKIISVLHSGEEGRRGAPRKESAYTYLLGKNVLIDVDSVEVGAPLMIEMIDDELCWNLAVKCCCYTDNVTGFSSGEPINSMGYRQKTVYEIETERVIYRLLEVE